MPRRQASLAVVCLVVSMSFAGVLPEIRKRQRAPEQHRARVSGPRAIGNLHLGAEYYNISSALADGRGFADPFYVRSGPTAWMPPLLVWLQAPLAWIFGGDRYWVMLIVVSVKSMVLCGCGIAVVAFDRQFRGWLACAIFAVFVLSESRACFEFTHDGWLILIGVTATALMMPRLQQLVNEDRLRLAHTVKWGAVGGLIALCSPVAAFAWAVATTVCFCRRATTHWIIAGLVSMVVISPWVIRNQLVLDRFIPIKSNIFFELDQSFALDNDGVISSFSLHPYSGGMERDLYVRLGEVAYLDLKKQRFNSQLRDDPGGFIARVRNRLLATTILPVWFPEFWRRPGLLCARWLIYPIPAIVALVLLFGRRMQDPIKKYAVIVYFAYLIPYVICSYYPRYGFPLLTLKVMFMYWAAVWGCEKIRKGRAAALPKLAAHE